MSRLLLLVLTAWALSVNADPQLLALNKFTSAASYNVNGVEAGALLFVATMDDYQFLKNITIKTGDIAITLDRVNDFNDDGSPKSFELRGDLTISTTNNDAVTNALTGNIYITTRAQAIDPTFFVFVVKGSHAFQRSVAKSTTVVLSTRLQQAITDVDQPGKVSYVTNINHSPNTNIYFQLGIPPTNWNNVTNNIFYKNPIVLANGTDTQKVFFDNVEPLQIGLDCWYVTAMGPYNMNVASKYVSDHSYSTTAVNTTGFVVNSNIYQNHVVNFQPDKTRTGVSGVFVSAVTTKLVVVHF